jgi:hypothetical protein
VSEQAIPPARGVRLAGSRWAMCAVRIALAAIVLCASIAALVVPATTPLGRFIWCLAVLETVGAVLLLLSRTVRWGAGILLAVYSVATAIHIVTGRPWAGFAFAVVAFTLVILARGPSVGIDERGPK